MAGDVERFLIDKLNQAIEDTKSTEHYLLAKLFRLDRYFRRLKDLLNNPNNAAALGKTKPREILFQLNNVVSEWQLISKKSGLEGIVDAQRLSMKLRKIKKDLKVGNGSSGSSAKSISSNTVQDTQESLPKNLDTYRWSSRTVDPSRVHGLDDKVRFFERQLLRKESKDGGFKAIAVFGMLGVGKSTLCQVMFNSPKVKDEFLPRIWVCLSKQAEENEDNRREIVRRMLVCLGVEDEIIDSAGQDPIFGLQKLIFLLRLQLMGKKYLIVLDDAWNPDECFENLGSSLFSTKPEESCYKQLAYGLPKGHGGTVIVTSRSEEIAKKMVGEENSHHLLPLKDRESCWHIFMDSVEKDGKRFPEILEKLKDMIIDKCAGLPLAAKMMGEIMHRNLSIEKPVAAFHCHILPSRID